MPGDEDQNKLFYPTLVGGWNPYAPPQSMTPGSGNPELFRDALNLVPREGVLHRRPSVTLGSLSTQPDPTIWTAGTVTLQGEIPVWIYSGIITDPGIFADGNVGIIVVTTKQVYVSRDGGNSWANLTPTYSTGTVTATNGSTAVSGAGTAWTDRSISADQFIHLDSTWYRIANVGSNTTLTLASAYTGATGGGKAYTIRRVWGGGSTLGPGNQFFCVYSNGDLYIAGTFLGNASATPAPAVIKITDALTSGATSTYLTGDRLYIPGLDTISGLKTILGIDVLQIGSVVLVGTENIFYYSSLLDDTVWSVSPAGFEPVYLGTGAIFAMGRMGGNLTLHFAGDIVLAIPVNQAEPPVAFQRTDAKIGCYAARTLKLIRGTERFIGIDGRLYAFDGNITRVIAQPVTRAFELYTRKYLRFVLHASVDESYGEYWLFHNLGSLYTLAYSNHLDLDVWMPHQYGFPIGVVSDRNDSAFANQTAQALVGVGNFDGSNSSQKTNMLFDWKYDAAVDLPDGFNNHTAEGHRIRTEDLDFGVPDHYKSIQRVIVFLRGTAAQTESLTAEITRDGGGSWIGPAQTKSVTLSTTGLQLVQFSFDSFSGAAIGVRIKTVSDSTLYSMLIKLLIVWELGAEIASVETL